MTRREDGTYNIEFDDKEIFKEFKVPVTRIRKVSEKHGIKREMSEEARKRGSVGVGGRDHYALSFVC